MKNKKQNKDPDYISQAGGGRERFNLTCVLIPDME